MSTTAPITDVDTTAADMLHHGDVTLDEDGVQLVGAELTDPVRRKIDRYELTRTMTSAGASMVGIGDLLGAQFLAATGGDMAAFASADHLAGYAGLAPALRDSERRTGNLHRPAATTDSYGASSLPPR